MYERPEFRIHEDLTQITFSQPQKSNPGKAQRMSEDIDKILKQEPTQAGRQQAVTDYLKNLK